MLESGLFLFLLVLVFFPRFGMIYAGSIVPGSIVFLGAFTLAPRLTIAFMVSDIIGDFGPIASLVMWLLAIVFDLIGFTMKCTMVAGGYKAQKEIWDSQVVRYSRPFERQF